MPVPRSFALALAFAFALAAVSRRGLAAFGSAFAVAVAAHAAPGAVVKTDQVRAELVAHAPEGVVAGGTLHVGLRIDHAPHWHTYWQNPGDSGLPTTLAFEWPAGFAAGDIQWPTPKRLPLGPLVNFGYEGTLLLPVVVRVPAGFTGDSLALKLRADWLVCKDVCIPESGEFAITVPARAATAGYAALFEAARAALPQAVAGARASIEVEGEALVVRAAGLPAAWQGRTLTFFPAVAGVIQNAATPEARWEGDAWQARVPLDAQRSAAPREIAFVLGDADSPGRAGLALTAAVGTPWPHTPGAVAAPAPALGNAEVIDAPAGASVSSLPLAIAFAFLGGLLLNLMPCVFPVLSLKLLGFAQAGAEGRSRRLAGGLAYTAGVVLSFLALAGALIALRAGGEQLGWGFQLQSPLVIAGLAVLFTLIGLNLAGSFEFGSVLPSRLAAARARHPVADDALTGVLAVAVASPCTAPFMGAALGFAFTLPAASTLAVFAALGLGMAAPYLAASASPALARALPRPGAWMATFKVAMAFPMFATVVWLVWVLGQQAGIDGAAGLLGVLVAVAFVAWALAAPGVGRWPRRALAGTAVAVLAAALAWALPSWQGGGPDVQAARGTGPGPVAADGWEAWSPTRVAELRAEGRPVFVDFTAAWCVTCQFVKRTVLADDALVADFRAQNVALLRADWTRRDPQITAELQRLGRQGVPVYLVYPAAGTPPRLLGELPSVADVRQALALPAS
jgi:thiol:disulfide interchange protein DsbD